MIPSLTMFTRINTISDPPPQGRHRDAVGTVSIPQVGWVLPVVAGRPASVGFWGGQMVFSRICVRVQGFSSERRKTRSNSDQDGGVRSFRA